MNFILSLCYLYGSAKSSSYRFGHVMDQWILTLGFAIGLITMAVVVLTIVEEKYHSN